MIRGTKGAVCFPPTGSDHLIIMQVQLPLKPVRLPLNYIPSVTLQRHWVELSQVFVHLEMPRTSVQGQNDLTSLLKRQITEGVRSMDPGLMGFQWNFNNFHRNWSQRCSRGFNNRTGGALPPTLSEASFSVRVKNPCQGVFPVVFVKI